ncbi:MAG: hypothetical protein JNK88_09395 [Mangrovicoccus sp.]|nr:hypothetical protein [Mangrovicoccus sp.]
MRAAALGLLLLAAACAPGGQGATGTVGLVALDAQGQPVSAAAAPARTAPVAAMTTAAGPRAAPVATAAAVPAAVRPGPPPIADDAIYNPKSSTPLVIRSPDPSRYEVVRPRAVPARPREQNANIVAYALAAPNRVGQGVYVRDGDAEPGVIPGRCARYVSEDTAQEAFLEAGGPDADPLGIDPDGDGFACGWDPAPYRRAVR